MFHVYTLLTALIVASLALSGCQPVQPVSATETEPERSSRQIRGEMFLPSVPEWGGVAVSLEFDLQEADPETHEAVGLVNWRNFTPEPFDGRYWKVVHAEAAQVYFGEDAPDGEPNTAVIVAKIRDTEGWGQGEPGEYAYFWLHDGGSDSPDEWAMRYYSFDPWYEFYPSDNPPTGYFTRADAQEDDPTLPLAAEAGDIVIQRTSQ